MAFYMAFYFVYLFTVVSVPSNIISVRPFALKIFSTMILFLHAPTAARNHVHIALNESGQACLALLDILSGTLRTIVQIVSFSIIVIQLNWVLIPLCLLTSIPILLLNLKMTSYWHGVLVHRAKIDRFVQYLKLLLTKNENIKEAKLYKLYSRLT